jgi:endonuclease YncB( thermonuclease family)
MCMVPKAARLLTAMFFCCFLYCSSAQAWEGVVVTVPDGDSLEVKQGDLVHKIRLYGIDCPEYGQASWIEARGLTRAMALGQRLSVEPMDTDKYGRIVALVWSQGGQVNSELVRKGQAWVYPRYCQKQPLCRDMNVLEQTARAARLGLWHQPNPTPPWSWRHSRP